MQIVAKTARANLRPLGNQGMVLLELRPQILRLLRNVDGVDPAVLFAEPVHNANRDEITWLTPAVGRVHPLSALAESEQAAAREMLGDALNAIETRIAVLRQGNTEDIEDAQLLELALNTPDKGEAGDNVHVVDAGPVLVNWGCASVEGGARALSSLRFRIRPRPVTPRMAPPLSAFAKPSVLASPTAIRPRSLGWLGWFAPALLLFVIILFLYARLYPGTVPVIGAVANPPVLSASDSLTDEEAALRREITELSMTLMERKAQCHTGAMQDSGTVESYESSDAEIAELQERCRHAGCEEGEVTVALHWERQHDLDLHVFTPSREHIYFGNKSSNRGGKLDKDANAGSRRQSNPVEHIHWKAGEVQPGRYIVIVNLYSVRGSLPVPFKILLEKDGQISPYRGRLDREKESKKFEFTVP